MVCSLIAVLLGWTIVDGIEQGQRNGAIYPDNTPPLGPHHWDPLYVPTAKGYQNSEPTIKQISLFCFPIQTAPEFPWYQSCIW